MSTLNSLYKSDYNISPNYYERKIKEGIPIFQEIGSYNNTMSNQNYVDPFKILENNKTNTFLNNGGVEGSFSNINMYDVETRKIIEREMSPYILQMKNELNIIVEKFRKEMEEKSNIFNEISLLKEQVSQNKKNNEIINSNIEEKILNIKDILNIQDKKINAFQNDFSRINTFNQDINKKTDELYSNINDLKRINDKMMSMDASNENIYNVIANNIEKKTNSNYDQLNKNLDLLKEEISSIKKDIFTNNTKLLSLNSENDIKNNEINEIKIGISKIKNQIDNVNINNHTNLNLINNLEIKNNEFQQNLKSLNDKISILNNNFNANYVDVKSNKQLLNSSSRKLSDIENSINFLKNEKQSLNNKITELNSKIDSQAEKIIKNNNLLNETVSQNLLYKDLTSQMSKSKEMIGNLRDKCDEEINKLRSELEQFDLIIKNNPFLNMNENEHLSIMFKKEQLKSNDLFKEQIRILSEEINKLKNANPMDKDNIKKIENNFKIIDKMLIAKGKDINLIEEGMKSTTEVVKILSEKLDILKKEINSFKNIKNDDNEKKIIQQQPPIINEIKFGDIETDIKNMQKYININKKDINDIKIDIKEINDKTIPEIYKYINDYLNDKINIAKSNKLEMSKKSNNNRYQIRVSDVSNYNNINNKNSMGSNLFNQNSVNKDITNNSKNFIINNPSNPSNQIDKDKNIDDIANQIELMGGGNPKINNEYNKNNVNNKINVIKENNFDKNSSNNDWREKNDESDSINRIINEVKEKKQNISKNSFDLDFDS